MNVSTDTRVKTTQYIKKRSLAKGFKRNWPLHVMIWIPLIFIFLFRYLPMPGILIGFMKFNPALGFFKSPWIGMQNYKTLFTMPGFTQALRNTVIIAVAKVVLGILVPVTFSLLLNEIANVYVKRTIQTVIYIPHFISWVLIAGIMMRMLGATGIVNQFLGLFGLEPILFLSEKQLFRPVIIITNLWKEFGYGTIIYLAAITGVDSTLYEAARVDGAGHWKQTWHVTPPAIIPTIVLMGVLSLGNVLNAGFDQIFNLYSPIVYETGDIIDTFTYRVAFVQSQFGISTAAGFFKSVITCILTVFSYRIAYRTTGYRVF